MFSNFMNTLNTDIDFYTYNSSSMSFWKKLLFLIFNKYKIIHKIVFQLIHISLELILIYFYSHC